MEFQLIYKHWYNDGGCGDYTESEKTQPSQEMMATKLGRIFTKEALKPESIKLYNGRKPVAIIDEEGKPAIVWLDDVVPLEGKVKTWEHFCKEGLNHHSDGHWWTRDFPYTTWFIEFDNDLQKFYKFCYKYIHVDGINLGGQILYWD